MYIAKLCEDQRVKRPVVSVSLHICVPYSTQPDIPQVVQLKSERSPTVFRKVWAWQGKGES